MIAHCIRNLPMEGCGLLVGAGSRLHEVVPSANVAHSAKVYEIEPKVLLRTYRDAENQGLDVLGCFHSHTHSDPYPSPTDIAQAPDPSWHYVLVSLRFDVPAVRSYRIVDGVVTEEDIHVISA
jgi:[CysO sulfur-carrier protein]-S-L-cysteine hydrolase